MACIAHYFKIILDDTEIVNSEYFLNSFSWNPFFNGVVNYDRLCPVCEMVHVIKPESTQRN